MGKNKSGGDQQKNRNDGRERLKNFHCDETIRRCSQRGEQDEAERFAGMVTPCSVPRTLRSTK